MKWPRCRKERNSHFGQSRGDEFLFQRYSIADLWAVLQNGLAFRCLCILHRPGKVACKPLSIL